MYMRNVCIVMNQVARKKKRVKDRKKATKRHRGKPTEAEMPWGGIWVKPSITSLLYPLEQNSMSGGVPTVRDFRLGLLPIVRADFNYSISSAGDYQFVPMLESRGRFRTHLLF